ncbi:extracellular solute-binding protein [Leifsonia poae]|uniref:Sugar ABC transporter substrate-binding protein n=1 Tax=Leifsonia poae TaxID=110933 RepID=A0A9W6LZ61_9MICO|nr:extracellular solute-binding protein [Leifsonia poae]GLJ75913.1 sugar ABC transporter substrate-binding protein [Leifsonia poae]
MKRSRILAAVVAASTLVALAGCSSSGSNDGKTIKVAYQDFGSDLMSVFMNKAKKGFEAANPGEKVTLVPIKAAENDYYTKLALMNRSASTAPDVLYEDTFLIRSDAQAGYLEPLDSYVKKWADWSQFFDNAKDAGKGDDGKIYGVSMGTDTRGLWYNKEIFAKAGLPTDWKPKTWADVMDAAKTIKSKVPGVTPINIFSGKAGGEASSMQGFEMLLYGASKDGLYDASSGKWITGSQAFTDSLKVLKDVYQGGLGPSQEITSDTNYQNIVTSQLLPEGKLAINLDGSWVSNTWQSTGAKPWADWNKVMGTAPMPTQNGDDPGSISMSGGWTLSMGAKSKAKDEAFKFITYALNKDNSLDFAIKLSQIPVRKDVAADPAYAKANPTSEFFSSLVAVTKFRPATPDYSKISNGIQVAMESVMTGQQSPAEAAKAYDDTVVGIVGKDKTESE